MKILLCLFSFSFAILLASCENEGSKDTQIQDSIKVQDSNINTSSMDSIPEREEIALEKLPEKIENKIKVNALLSTFSLKKAEKVLDGEEVYYDITFKDPDQQTVMASFDKMGNLIGQ